MSDLVTVGISDAKIAESPVALVTYALGSCIGICLYDGAVKIGGLAHIMLPYLPESGPREQIWRYADSSLPALLRKMETMGCRRERILAKIAGGAKMFDVADDSTFGSSGFRNVGAVKETLEKLRIRLAAEDTGLNYGRTVYFYTETGDVVVKSFANGNRNL